MTDSSDGAPPLPPGVKRKRGANGKDYYYYEVDGAARRRIESTPGELGWERALAKAMRRVPAPPAPTRADTLPKLIEEWTASPEWKRTSKGTQVTRRSALKRIERWFREFLVSDFNERKIRRDIFAFRNSMSDRPAGADTAISTLSAMLNWAYDQGADITVNHAQRVGRLYESWRSDIVWTDDDRERFWREAMPAVSYAHQALYYSAARIVDVAAWQPENYDGRWLAFTPRKTARKTRVEVHLPVYLLPPFKALLDRVGLPLRTKTGCRWQQRHLSNELSEEIARVFGDEMDLHSHDLRGTVSTKLVDAGCTDREVSAITGHVTPKIAQERAASLSLYVKRTRQQAINAYTKWWAAEWAPEGKVIQFPERA